MATKKILFPLILFFVYFTAGSVFALNSVNINTASLKALETLAEIGPVKAQAITDARPFSSIDDLLRVKGIGPKTLQKIKDQSIACVECPTEVAQIQEIIQEEINQNVTPPPEQVSPPIIIYPTGIFLNEILPNPEGADETNEWIEIYNSNKFDVDLSNWQLQDVEGNTKTYSIQQDTKISAEGFLLFKRPETKIMLNNDRDGVNLLTPNKNIINSISFTSAPLNQSYNKTSSNWQWSTTLTPLLGNIIYNKTSIISSKSLSNSENSVKNDDVAIGLADISQSININQDDNTKGNPWFLFLTVLVTTIILAILVLLIKIRLKGAEGDIS